MTKKNIIFFLPNFSHGGASQSICKILYDLNKKKYNCYLICLNNCIYKKKLIKNSVKVIEINEKRTIFSFFKIRKKVLDIIKKNNLKSIFISNINYANVLSIIFLKSLKKLKIVTVDRTPIQELNINNNIYKLFKNNFIKLLIKFVYKYADIRIGNSKQLSNDISKISNSKLITIYPKSIEKILPYKKKNYKNKSILNIIWIGRLSHEKEFDTIINCINLIKKKNILINVIGIGNEKNKYLTKIKKLNIKNKFKFWGYQENINSFLKKSHLNINSSIYEGFPNSVIQSINCSVPIIASKSCGAINEILSHGKFGNFYNTKDYLELSKVIKEFIENSNPFIEKARLAHKNLKKFNFDQSSNKYEKIFKNLK